MTQTYARRLPKFSLEELSQIGPLLIGAGRAFHWRDAEKRWVVVADLESLVALDVAALPQETPGAPGDLADALQTGGQSLLSMLPATITHVVDTLVFLVHAERYRLGKPAISVSRAAGQGGGTLVDHLYAALGFGRSASYLVDGGRVFLLGAFSSRRLAVPPAGVPEPSSVLRNRRANAALSDVRSRYERSLLAAQQCSDDNGASQQEIELALSAVRETLQGDRTLCGRRVIYESAQTGLLALLDAGGMPDFAILSDHYAVEDADGQVYQFDGFMLAVRPAQNRPGPSTLTSPVILRPKPYEHWRPEFKQPGAALLMCDYFATQGGPERALRLDNVVDLLLAGRHTIRAGRFGTPGQTPALAAQFPHRKISRERAEQLGLPIYPFCRSSERMSGGSRAVQLGTFRAPLIWNPR